MDRFEPVPGVGQRALHDDAHGVIEVRLAHFVLETGQPDVADFHDVMPLRDGQTIPKYRHKSTTNWRER